MKTHDILLICIILILGTSFIYVRDIWKATYVPFNEKEIDHEPQPQKDIHSNDLVRIKQYVEVYHLLYGTYQVHTEIWCTYKDKLYCEESIYNTVYKDEIDSTKKAQYNKLFPYYQKLDGMVKNKLLNP